MGIGVAIMTEKRFTVEDDDADIWEDNHFLAVAYNHINAKKITKRLNKLADENEKLKKDCSNLIDDNTEYVSEINHIKQVIKEAYNNERTHIGRNVLKQLLNNIGETND